MTLHVLKSSEDAFFYLLKDDPIRPEIPAADRFGSNKDVMIWLVDNQPMGVVCINYQDFVPNNVNDLIHCDDMKIAVFYTIWTYKSGIGKKLLFAAKEYIKENRSAVIRFITLSPKTEMARNFHIGNGAIELKVNTDTVNYEYI